MWRVGIRAKVVLLALVLLAIPWIGYQYVTQIENTLREGQERALMGTARAVATALHDRPQLFELAPRGGAGQSTQLIVAPLGAAIKVDGHSDDWRANARELEAAQNLGDTRSDTFFGATSSVRARYGRFAQTFYALFEVQDNKIVAAVDASAPLKADHVLIAWVTPDGALRRYALALGGLDTVRVARLDESASSVAGDPMRAALQLTAQGYNFELEMPLALVGAKLGFELADVDDPDSGQVESLLGISGTQSADQLAGVLIPETEVAQILKGLARTTSRISVVDANGRVLARIGDLARSAQVDDTRPAPRTLWQQWWQRIEGATLRRVYARLLRAPQSGFTDEWAEANFLHSAELDSALKGTPSSRWRQTSDERVAVLSAAHPIWNGAKAAGAVMVEETTNQILAARNRALETLFNTVLAVFALGALPLVAFASRVSSRLRRLRDEAEQAVDSHGRIQRLVAGSSARDEIGDLSRSFSGLLTKLTEYTSYLENMASRLSHELRTPIAVVRSSLDNMQSEPLPDAARVYMQRAQTGLARLSLVLTRISEATRLEQALKNAERERFDLCEVIAGCVQGYRGAYPQHAFLFDRPAQPILIDGAPELIAQLLDKLVSNAVEFARGGTPIEIQLKGREPMALLSVTNVGPLLPETMRERLFGSMVSVRRQSEDATPHLGLGLYIVRLVAEFHRGEAHAENLTDGSGVEVRILLPVAD